MRQGDVAKSFVLVHGAWHGGWCWRRVADRLQAAGHKVWTPTLTGLGERSHLIGTHIDLSTHVTDIVNVLKWERLSDVALCGHSYGGFVISGVAEAMPEAIRCARAHSPPSRMSPRWPASPGCGERSPRDAHGARGKGAPAIPPGLPGAEWARMAARAGQTQ